MDRSACICNMCNKPVLSHGWPAERFDPVYCSCRVRNEYKKNEIKQNEEISDKRKLELFKKALRNVIPNFAIKLIMIEFNKLMKKEKSK